MSQPRTWMTITPTDDPKKFEVRYSRPNLGFTVDKTVDGDTARMLQHAISAGKDVAKAEIRELLGF